MIYEFFRRTRETYICLQINFKNYKNKKNILNIDLTYLKHMLEQILINSLINMKIWFIGDIKIDYHHSVEDLGISIGKIIKYFIPSEKKNYLNRYGFSYVPLDDALSRVVVDISGRSYLSYNIFYYNLYIKNFNVNLFYDFFVALIKNSNITVYIDNLIGFNTHHIFESIFKALGRAFFEALNERGFENSSKGIIF